jgi:glutaredoxin 3
MPAPRMNMPDIEIYTTRYCPYCLAAKRLLSHKGAAFTEIDVSGDRVERSKMVVRANGRMTVPQIFIGATHVGGYDELHALDQAGKLDPLLVAGDPLVAGEEPPA